MALVPLDEPEQPKGTLVPLDAPRPTNPILQQIISEMSPLEVGLVNVGEGMSSSYRGIKQLLGIDRQGMADNAQAMDALRSARPAASLTGQVIGAFADPVSAAIPAAKATSLLNLAKGGAIGGGLSGGLGYARPDENRAMNALIGAGAGAVAAPALGSVISRAARGRWLPIDEPAKVAPVVDDVAKVVDTPASAPMVQASDDLTTVVTPKPENKAGNINLNYINTTDDVKGLIKQIAVDNADEVEVARRGVISSDQTKEMAEALGMSADDLAKRRKGQAFNAEEAYAARTLLVQSAEDLQAAAKSAVGQGDEALAEFMQKLSRHTGIQMQVSGMTAEAGRALRQFQIVAESPAMKAQAIKNIVDRFGRENVDEIAQAVSQLDTPEQINKFARQAMKPGASKMVMEAWINALLSGPQTHVVNAISNTLTNVMQIPERAIAAGLGALRKGEKVAFSEPMAMVFGTRQGLKDGVKAALHTLKTGEALDDLSKIELSHYRAITGENLGLKGGAAKVADVVGEGIRLPGRFLASADEFFKAVASRQELSALAARKAGGDKEKIAELLANPTDEMLDAAHKAAQYVTFTKPVGKVATAVMTATNEHPYLKLVMPFVRTPVNILKFAGERTPLAMFSQAVRKDLAQGGVTRDVALARMAMGTTIGASVATMAAEGTITGGGPANPEDKAAMRNVGWQPYSIKLGDTYHAYNRFEPMGILFGLSADAAEIAKTARGEQKKELEQIPKMITAAISQNLTNKTFMRGLTDAMLSMADPDRYGDKWWLSTVGTVVPTGVSQAAATSDPILREADTALARIKSRIPGYSEDLPARRNVWGKPIEREGGVGPDILSPVYVSKEKDDPVAKEVARLKMRISMPDRRIEGERIPAEKYSEYVKTSGEMAHSILSQVVAGEGYKNAPALAKEKIFKEVVEQSRKIARVQVGLETQAIQSRVKSEVEKLNTK
jgi:hypothetical protein